jgi:hypothetical protein
MLTKPYVIENFITPEDADVLLNELRTPSERNPYPAYYQTRFGGTGYPYNKRTLELQKKYSLMCNDIHQTLNTDESKTIRTFKCFGSTWVPGEFGLPHIDDQAPEEFIEYSTIIYLDDDFEGGVLFFPALSFEYVPKKYSAVFFPSRGMLWNHGITPIESGSRSTLLYMHTTKTEHPNGFVVVDPDLN